jgi:hypothetical protein
MIKLYTDSSFIQSEIIYDNDAFFNVNVTPKDINEFGKQCMKDIDGAIIVPL